MKTIKKKSSQKFKKSRSTSKDIIIIKENKHPNPKNITTKKKILKKVGNKKKIKNVLKNKILSKKILRHRAAKNLKKKSKISRGVVYLSHVPHGFYENEMKAFFNQFGKVTNINIPRSTRTGKYKGYAFVEFLYPDVAKIVAETMNNYLMFQKVLKAKYIPPEEQKPICFHFPKMKQPLIVRRQKFLRQQSHRQLNEKMCLNEADRLQKLLQNKLKKLKKLGINYKFQIANDTRNLEDSDEFTLISEENLDSSSISNLEEQPSSLKK